MKLLWDLLCGMLLSCAFVWLSPALSLSLDFESSLDSDSLLLLLLCFLLLCLSAQRLLFQSRVLLLCLPLVLAARCYYYVQEWVYLYYTHIFSLGGF